MHLFFFSMHESLSIVIPSTFIEYPKAKDTAVNKTDEYTSLINSQFYFRKADIEQ